MLVKVILVDAIVVVLILFVSLVCFFFGMISRWVKFCLGKDCQEFLWKRMDQSSLVLNLYERKMHACF